MLTTLAFAERLGKSDVGRAILAEGEARLDLLVKDFVRTYDRFGRASKEVYRKNAQMAAVIVGIGLAFVANIDAGRLINALVENPDLRAGLIADAESAAKANTAAMESLDAVLKAAEEKKLEGVEIKEIKARFAALVMQANAAQARGLPVGWSYFPYCRPANGAAPQARCGPADGFAAMSGRTYLVEFATWLVLTVLAGFLIGLGGPFWYRVFASLSQVAQMLRSVGIGGKKPPPDGTPGEPEPTPAEESARPRDVLDAFRVAAEGAHGGRGES